MEEVEKTAGMHTFEQRALVRGECHTVTNNMSNSADNAVYIQSNSLELLHSRS